MARGEGEPGGIHSHFVERVVKLPMVHVAWDYAANTYTQIKGSNKLVNFTLTNAEKSVTFVAGQAKPVVMKFEKQIQAVDDLACKGLGTLEEKVPFIRKPADEIITDTRNLYTSTVYSRFEGIKNYGINKVKTVADYGLDKANAIFGKELVDSLLNTVDGALVVTDTYIDRVLPPTADEKKKSGRDEAESTLSRLTNIPSKILHRSYRALVLKIENIQERSIELLIYPLSYAEATKVHLENALRFVLEQWETLKTQGTSETDGEDKSKPVTALSTAVRDNALWVIGIVKVIPQVLPMYIYGFVSWLEEKREKQAKDETKQPDENVKENGSVKPQNNSTHHSENSSNCEPNCHMNHHDEGSQT